MNDEANDEANDRANSDMLMATPGCDLTSQDAERVRAAYRAQSKAKRDVIVTAAESLREGRDRLSGKNPEIVRASDIPNRKKVTDVFI